MIKLDPARLKTLKEDLEDTRKEYADILSHEQGIAKPLDAALAEADKRYRAVHEVRE